jgi:hypothetical protein
MLRLDPSLYATAETVIPVFWLGLLYQVNAYDLAGDHKPKSAKQKSHKQKTEERPTNPFALASIMIVTVAAVFGEIHVFGALFDTRLAVSARWSVANALYLTGAPLFLLPAWRMAAREAEGSVLSVIVFVIFMTALLYGDVYVIGHVG